MMKMAGSNLSTGTELSPTNKILPAIGIARKNSLYYAKHFGISRSTANGGVQLLDLAGMRMSTTYMLALHGFASGERALWVTLGDDGNFSRPFLDQLGDQTIYTAIRNAKPTPAHDLFFELPCEWNRQLGSWTTESTSVDFGLLRNDGQSAAVQCQGGCAILHANHPSFKQPCLFNMMRLAALNCSSWREFIAFAHTPESLACCGHSIARPMWRAAFERFWGGCCQK